MKTQLQFLSNTFLSTVENWYFFFHRLGKNVVTKHSGGAKDISFQLDEKKKKTQKINDALHSNVHANHVIPTETPVTQKWPGGEEPARQQCT